MILNINQLRSFYTAARNGSISRAAGELMVTPPAISMQIKELEERVGMRLLLREGNGIRLTHTGEEIFRRADRIFQEIGEMEGFLEDVSTGKSGELRIGCPEIPAKQLMPGLVEEFKKTHPGIRLVLNQGSNAEMIKSIMEHKNELVFVRADRSAKFRIKVLRRDEYVLVAAPQSKHLAGSEVSIMQLASVPLVITGEGSAIRELVLDYFRKFRVSPHIVMESSSASLLREFVRRDTGVGFLQKDAAQEEVKKGYLRVVHILEGEPAMDFGIGYRNRRDLSPAAWAFLRLLEKSENIGPFLE
jgi:DNA-binding transcriptional LysR family regulator